MGRYRPPRQAAAPPPPRQTVLACWVSPGPRANQWTVTITPPNQEPLLVFVEPRYVVVDTPPTDDRDVEGQLKVHLLHMSDHTANIQLPAAAVGLGTKITVPKTMLASIPMSTTQPRGMS